MKRLLIVSAAAVLLLVVWANITQKKPTAPSPGTTGTAAPAPATKPQREQETAESKAARESRLESCRDKLKAAANLNLLADMSFDNGIPRVVVGRTWYNIDFSAKTGLAETCACFFLAGDTSKAIRFDIKDKMTGKTVAVWDYTRLKVD